MKKIKVLHITQAVIGGTLEYLKLFFKYIDKEKYEVELICPSYGPMKSEIEKMGFKVYPVEMKRGIDIINDYRCYREVKKIINTVKPNLVHCHSSKAGVIGRIASYKNKVPCVYNAHGWSFSMNINHKKKKFYAVIEKFCSKYCDVIINISDFEQKLALDYKIAPQNKMTTIYNGIDITKYEHKFDNRTILKEIGIPENSYIVGMVGRLTKQKSPETFIKIAEILSKKIDNCYFILVGDGDLRSEIEDLISLKKLNDKIKITGWTNEANKYVSIFDVGILTSKWEGFGLVLAEYMAAKKPVVASNVGGIPEIIRNGYNGFLVTSGDYIEFSKKILQIYNDNNLKVKLVKNAYNEVINKFNVNRVIDEHEKAYFDILDLKNKCQEDKCEYINYDR